VFLAIPVDQELGNIDHLAVVERDSLAAYPFAPRLGSSAAGHERQAHHEN